MELYQVRTFVTVADEKHLTRAAKRLNTSQPAVSAHIKALEEELGVRLFDRTSRGMSLTTEGEALLPYAEKLLIAGNDLLIHSRNLRTSLAGNVSVGLNTDPEFLRSSDFFRYMSQQAPDLKFTITQSISGQIIQDIQKGILDSGYIFGENTSDDIEIVFLKTFNLRIIGPYQWKDRIDSADWKELASLPWIGNVPLCPYTPIFNTMFRSRKLKASIHMVADQESTIKSLVAAGVGMSFMIEDDAFIAEDQGEVAVWKKESIPHPLSFIFLKSRREDPVIKAVLRGVESIWKIR